MSLFRELSPKEEQEFRQWAKNHYIPFTDIKGIWHPITQDECRKINEKHPCPIPPQHSTGSE